jgi:antitoxin ParD1/3/4
MPSKRTLNVSLTIELYDFIGEQLNSGRFGTASEVVRAGLRLLEKEAETRHPSRSGFNGEAFRDTKIGKSARTARGPSL